MNTTNDAPSFWERLRDYPYDFVAHFMNLLYGVVLTNGLLERVQASLIVSRTNKHGLRDIINAPPSAGSWMEAVGQPVWRLGLTPRIQMEVITKPAMADLARALIEHPDYAQIFPEVKLAPTDDPSVLQTTAGGRIVYRTLDERRIDIRPKLLVIDTPQAQADVATQAARDASFALVEAACSHVMPTGSISLFTHRQHADDVTARLAGTGKYKICRCPVVVPEKLVIQTRHWGATYFKGHLTDPIAWPHARIAKLQDLLSPAIFAAHYLQAPLDPSDNDES